MLNGMKDWDDIRATLAGTEPCRIPPHAAGSYAAGAVTSGVNRHGTG